MILIKKTLFILSMICISKFVLANNPMGLEEFGFCKNHDHISMSDFRNNLYKIKNTKKLSMNKSEFHFDTDAYGGMKTLKGKASKYFHLEKIDGRHCLVTPDGFGFITLGVNHIGAINERSPNDIFQENHNNDSKSVCFQARADLLDWNFNTVGYHSFHEIWKHMPAMASCYPVMNSQWRSEDEFSYADVWDSEFQQSVIDSITKMIHQASSNPNVIGYYWNDIPLWSLERARSKKETDWVSYIRSLPSSAAGKIKYIEFLKQKYGEDVQEIANLYGEIASNWSELSVSKFENIDYNNQVILSADYEFLRLIARELYRVHGETTRGLDPDRLVFGERYFLKDHPIEVLEEAAPWIDVISIQPYGNAVYTEELDGLYAAMKKPIIICDHQIPFAENGYDKIMWNEEESQEIAGRAYRQYLQVLFSKSYIIGYHRCQYVSRTVGAKLKQGLRDENEEPYTTYINYIRDTNQEILNTISRGKMELSAMKLDL